MIKFIKNKKTEIKNLIEGEQKKMCIENNNNQKLTTKLKNMKTNVRGRVLTRNKK